MEESQSAHLKSLVAMQVYIHVVPFGVTQLLIIQQDAFVRTDIGGRQARLSKYKTAWPPMI